MRYAFGLSASDWVFTDGTADAATLVASAVVTCWNAASGGTQYTDLALDAAGASPITSVTSSDGTDGNIKGTVTRFYGPDGITQMWASANGGNRVLMLTTDAGDIGASAAATLSAHTAQVNGHGTGTGDLVDANFPPVPSRSDGYVPIWDGASSKWVMLPPSATSGAVLLNPPNVGGVYVGNTVTENPPSLGSSGVPWLIAVKSYSSGDTNPDFIQVKAFWSDLTTKLKTFWINGNGETRTAPSTPGRIGFRAFESYETTPGLSTGIFASFSTNPTNAALREALLGVYGSAASSKPGWVEATRVMSALMGLAAGGNFNALSQLILRGRRTTAGAPSSGSWSTGDWIVDSVGAIWLCTTGGTPGTWTGTVGGVLINSTSSAIPRGRTSTAGAPASGTWSTGDWIIDSSGYVQLCTAGGTPGTWAGSIAPSSFTDITPATNVAHATKHAASRLERGRDAARLRGEFVISGALTAATLGTITTAHRPATAVNCIVRTTSGGSLLSISTGGVVTIGGSPTSGSVYLDGVTYDLL